MLNKLTNYIKETRIEMRKVNWPTRREAMRFTVTVIVASLVISAILGGFDFMFTSILQILI